MDLCQFVSDTKTCLTKRRGKCEVWSGKKNTFKKKQVERTELKFNGSIWREAIKTEFV
jgi:hypothetical protein